MVSNKKNAFVNVLLRSTSIIYLIVLGIILVPMYLKYIPVELYGYWLASGNTIAWIGDFAAVSAVMQQRIGVSFGTKDYHTIGQYVGTSMIISALIVFIMAIILMVFYHYIFGWLGITNMDYKDKLQYSLMYAGFGLLFTLLSFGFSGINYGLQLFKSVGFLSMGTNFACIVGTYLLLPQYGIKAFGLALLIRGILDLTGNIIILWAFLKKEKVSIRFSINTTKKLFGDVSFNFFARIGNILSRNSQLFFITKFITPESAVVFKFTKTIPEISKYFIAVPAEAIMPVFSKYLGQKPPIEDVKAKISKMIYYSFWGIGLVFIGFALLNKIFINLWVGETFYAGNATNIIIVFWVAISSLASNLMYTVFALGDLRRNNLVQFIQSMIFIVLMLLMIRPLGIMGIALALLLAEAIISMIYYPWSLQKYLHFDKHQINGFFKELICVCVTVSVMYLVAYKIDFYPKSWYGFAWYAIICTIGYFSGLYLTSQIFKMEIKQSLINFVPFINKINKKTI